MNRSRFILVALILVPCIAFAAEQPAAPATQPAAAKSKAAESKAVVKDGVSITLSLKEPAISTDQQPQFSVRFKNTSGDYINLYDVNAFWDWEIAFTPIDKQDNQSAPWILKMNKTRSRQPIAHKQIKPGESLEITTNLNDPPFTFSYVCEGPAEGPRPEPRRSLGPGDYRMTVKIALKNPFGPGYHEWMGPLVTEPVELNVHQTRPDERKQATPEEIAAYDKAINRVAERLQSGGLWMNGGFPEIPLAKDAKLEAVIDAAVNQTSLDSKAYRVLKVHPFSKNGMPQTVSGSAALVQVGKAYKVVIVFPFEKSGWWSRFYDAEVSPAAAQHAP